MNNEETSVNTTNQDPVMIIKAAITCAKSCGLYSSGFRNGLRYAIAVLTNTEQEYEEVK